MSKYTEKTAAAVCNRLLSAARRDSTRIALHDAWTDGAGRCCLTDGYRAYRLTKAPEGLNAALTVKPGKNVENGVNLDPIFAPLDAGQVEEMPSPDETAIKAFIETNSIQKGHKKVYGGQSFDLGERFPMVNAKYLLDLVRLFPAAKWFVNADPYARMVRPVFVVCDAGSACLLPVRSERKPFNAPEATPVVVPENAPAPVKPAIQKQPEILPGNSSTHAWFFVYSRAAGSKKYLVTDPGKGTMGMKLLWAPRFTLEQLEWIKEALDETAAENPGASFQVRKANGKTVVYTAVPTYSPEAFAVKYAA